MPRTRISSQEKKNLVVTGTFCNQTRWKRDFEYCLLIEMSQFSFQVTPAENYIQPEMNSDGIHSPAGDDKSVHSPCKPIAMSKYKQADNGSLMLELRAGKGSKFRHI